VPQLDDALSQVGVDDLEAARLEVGVEAALLGEHRLALGDAANAALGKQSADDAVVGLRIRGPVHDGAGGRRPLLEAGQIDVEVVERVGLDRRGLGAQRLEVGHPPDGVVAPAAEVVDGGVVAADGLRVG
jgi:hypothetical protein